MLGSAALAHQPGKHLDHAPRSDTTVDFDRQAFLRELVRHRQALELAAVRTSIEHEVESPYLVRPDRRLWSWSRARNTLSWALARHLEFCHTPQPMRPARAQREAVATQKNAHAPVAKARILRRKLRHPCDHRRVLDRLPRSIMQGRPSDLDQRANPPLRQAAARRVNHLATASRHAHHFFALISFITSISRSRSATSFLSRAFSCSSCFRRRTSSA